MIPRSTSPAAAAELLAMFRAIAASASSESLRALLEEAHT